MKRGLVGIAIGSLLLSLVSPTTGVASGEKSRAAAPPASVKLVWDADFPDPGFSKFGSSYYLFQTGRGHRNTTSSNPKGPYGARKRSMTVGGEPTWMDGTKAWAPNVFATTKDGKPLYVMYFTAWHKTYRTNCIGVATSRSRRTGYEYVANSRICAPRYRDHYEAIDPTHYRSVKGTHYLIYKTSYKNTRDWQIRAVRMDKYGIQSVTGSRPKITLPASMKYMESPSVILHNHKVWIFTSRGDWAKDCDYWTDVWKADEFWNGHFTRVRGVVMDTQKTGLCGPGGAQVIKDGSTTRIAFHAWKDRAHPTGDGIRRAYVGELKWTAGGPRLK